MKLLPNVNVSVRVITGEDANALSLPREAVHQDDGRRYVYEIVRGELKKRYIETSLSNLTRVEVTSGLADGALVAVASQNASPLREGLPVRVVQK
jgi:HlyD family secretion protein